jgi:ABC-type transport system substrate-binding protein
MKTRSRRSLRAATGLLLTLALLAALAAGCGGEGSGDAAGSGGDGGGGEDADVDPAEAADREGELTFAISYGFNSLDPHQPVNPGDAIWMRPVYDRLLTLADGPDGVEVAPQLATSYEFAEDGMSIAFELRDDVTFQDGTPFDGEAVKANVERALGPDSTVASTIASVESVEVVDPTHVVFHLTQPDAALPWTLADATAGMMVSPAAFDSDLRAEPAGSGPYRLVSAARDGEVVYERWDDHWDAEAGLARQVTISTIPDGNARFNGVRSGDYDAAYMSAPHDNDSRSLESEGFHWEQALSPISYGVLMNNTMPPFDDVRVRQAVSLAVDRAAISEELLHGLVPPSYQAFPEGYLGHDPELEDDPYDVDAARDLIAEAGAEGARVEIIQAMTSPQDQLAQVVQQALGDIGLEVELAPLSPTEANPTWRQGGHHGYVGTIISYAEPSQTLVRNYLGDDNPGEKPAELVELADAASVLPAGGAEREEAYQEIAAWMVENPVHVPLVQFSTVVLARPEVVGSSNLVVQDIGKLDLRGVGVSGS